MKRILKSRSFILLMISLPIIVIFSLIKPNSTEAIYKVESDRFWTNKVHSHKKFDMMILGDSRVYRGVSPQAINRIIPGINIANFGFSSGILDNEIFSEAYKKIDPAASQKIILIGISPGSLTDFENIHFHDIKKETNSEIADKLYFNYIVSKFFTAMKPSELLDNKIRIKQDNVKEIFYSNGWVASTSQESDHLKYIDSYENYWQNNKVSKKRIDDLCAKITDWTSSGVEVFAFRAPASREIDTLENRLSGFNEQELLGRIENCGGHWISVDDRYDRYLSYDGCHLNAVSAVRLSEDIALEMKKVLTVRTENSDLYKVR